MRKEPVSKPLKLLFVAPNPPSPQRVRPFAFIHALARRGHRLTVAAPLMDERERADLDALAEAGIAVVTWPLGPLRRALSLAGALAAGLPLQARYAWHPRLATILSELVDAAAAGGQPFALAHVEHLRASAYGLALTARLPVVWDSVDCISALFAQAAQHSSSRRSRLLSRFELARTRRYEAGLPARFRHTVVTSALDCAALRALAGPEPPITVIANGVDLDFFRPPQAPQPPRAPDTVLLTGRLSYHANVTAASFLVEEVMPRVWADRPAVQVVLAGAGPTREVRALADRRPGRVTVTGTLADLRPYLHQATVAVAPVVYGAGVQNKVLEAMATATPVVATPIAVRALDVVAGRDCLVAEGAGALAQAILGLLAQPERAAQLGAAGRAYVEGAHDWDGAAAQLDSVYAQVLRSS